MLILSRKEAESIMISDDIEIIVLSVSGQHVRLGINAPRHISVHRKEIFEKIQEEKAATKADNETEAA